ncbi:MAG: Rieske 2Fe-2S domain-containing protein [Pseudonocardia sp.]|nr:Rieske 2Fe-2S domain-containing protein [Pseudonocardia sp.]
MSLVPLGASDGRTAWTVEAPDGRAFAVFLVDGEHHVTDAACPHNKGPLVEGWLRDEGRTLVCPWHWFRYDLRTGDCHNLPRYRLGVHPVVERDGALCADVGEPTAAPSLAERLRAHARGED